jgi:hypothetical protein
VPKLFQSKNIPSLLGTGSYLVAVWLLRRLQYPSFIENFGSNHTGERKSTPFSIPLIGGLLLASGPPLNG